MPVGLLFDSESLQFTERVPVCHSFSGPSSTEVRTDCDPGRVEVRTTERTGSVDGGTVETRTETRTPSPTLGHHRPPIGPRRQERTGRRGVRGVVVEGAETRSRLPV